MSKIRITDYDNKHLEVEELDTAVLFMEKRNTTVHGEGGKVVVSDGGRTKRYEPSNIIDPMGNTLKEIVEIVKGYIENES